MHTQLLTYAALAVLAGSLAVPATGDACETNLPYLDQKVRHSFQGQFGTLQLRLYFDATHPDNTEGDDWGEGTLHSHDFACDSGRYNCAGEDYSYAVFDVDTQWQLPWSTSTTFTIGDADWYWDHYFSGYTQISGVDYTKNCHGYAFGVGDWPEDSTAGADILLKSGTCYSGSYTHNAHLVLTQGHLHSMKVEGFFPCTNPYNNWEIFTKTSEKFRESGVYEQTGTCGLDAPDYSADPLKAHGGAGYEQWREL